MSHDVYVTLKEILLKDGTNIRLKKQCGVGYFTYGRAGTRLFTHYHVEIIDKDAEMSNKSWFWIKTKKDAVAYYNDMVKELNILTSCTQD